MGVVEVDKARIGTFVVMAAKDDKGCASECCGVTASWSGGNTFDLRECPEPLAIDFCLSLLVLVVGLLHLLFHYF